MNWKQKSVLFHKDKILTVLTDLLKEVAIKKGYVIQDYTGQDFHEKYYSTKYLYGFDIPPNNLHIDEQDFYVKRIRDNPEYYVQIGLDYFENVRSIPRREGISKCWIYIEIFFRSISVYMTTINTNMTGETQFVL